MSEENTTETNSITESNKRVRSSFTMSKSVMSALKKKAVDDGLSVSTVIEKAVSAYVGV